MTGAASGIGRGIVAAAAEAGARVAALDLDGPGAEETIREIDGEGAAWSVDVTDGSAVDDVIRRAEERLGALSGWVNNAGVLDMRPARDIRPGDWGRQFEVNAHAVAICSRLAAERMVARGGGAIVNVASNAAKVGYPNMAVYNASKAAVVSLTRSFAAEWASDGINVNAVCPGGVDTPMLGAVAEWIADRDGLDAEALLAAMTPVQLGRHVMPIEVGRVVAFLLSPRAEIIRGQAINVDGGDTPY